MNKKLCVFLLLAFLSFIIGVQKVSAGYVTCTYYNPGKGLFKTAHYITVTAEERLDKAGNVVVSKPIVTSVSPNHPVRINYLEAKDFTDSNGKLFCADKIMSDLSFILFMGTRYDVLNIETGIIGNMAGDGSYSDANLEMKLSDLSHRDDPVIDPGEKIPTTELECSGLLDGEFGKALNTILNLMRFAAPILVLIYSIIDFIKAIATSDSDMLKKASANLIKRLLIAASIFFVATLVRLILGYIGIECTLI